MRLQLRARLRLHTYRSCGGCRCVRQRARDDSAKGNATGSDAAETARDRSRPFELVITDMQMPEMDGLQLIAKVRQRAAFRDLPVIMLSSGVHPDAVRCARDVAISAYLTKPIQPSELLDAMVAAIKPASVAGVDSRTQEPLVAKGSATMNVVLAEDTAVNKMLAAALVEKYGHKVYSAENGREAVALLERQAADVVLMELQMPVTDGYEAIHEIRANEQRSGGHLPIVALTAHAMQGDRERCLEARAVEYVSKPIRVAELFAAIDRALKRKAPSHRSASQQKRSSLEAAEVLDLHTALDGAGGDRDLLEELARLFIEGYPVAMEGIRRALRDGDAHLLQRLAHTMKGSSANCGADRVSQAALALDMQGRSEALEGADKLIETLQAELDCVPPESEAVTRKVIQ